MDNPIVDHESLSTEPLSFVPIDTSDDEQNS